MLLEDFELDSSSLLINTSRQFIGSTFISFL